MTGTGKFVIDPPDDDEDETIEIEIEGHDLEPDLRG